MTPWVTRLLFANVAVFFLQQTFQQITYMFAFVPFMALTRPWTMVTYMFLHGSLGHLFGNMLSLYFFGPHVESRLGSDKLLKLYFIGGITGALFSILFSPRHAVIGASAGVFGIMMAFAYFWPRERIYVFFAIPIEARWFVILMTIYSIYSGLGGSQAGVADFAHLGGYAGAYLYLRWVASNRGMKKFRKKATDKVIEKTSFNWQKVDLKSVHELNREEVNRILDKINATGLSSLTPQERLFLSNFVPPDDRTPVS